MTTLAEIEKAADALPVEEQQALLRHLSENMMLLKRKPNEAREVWPVPPPEVPIEELRRIHAIIEAEFSKVELAGG